MAALTPYRFATTRTLGVERALGVGADRDVPAGWIVRGTGELPNPENVSTARARERLTRVRVGKAARPSSN